MPLAGLVPVLLRVRLLLDAERAQIVRRRADFTDGDDGAMGGDKAFAAQQHRLAWNQQRSCDFGRVWRKASGPPILQQEATHLPFRAMQRLAHDALHLHQGPRGMRLLAARPSLPVIFRQPRIDDAGSLFRGDRHGGDHRYAARTDAADAHRGARPHRFEHGPAHVRQEMNLHAVREDEAIGLAFPVQQEAVHHAGDLRQVIRIDPVHQMFLVRWCSASRRRHVRTP